MSRIVTTSSDYQLYAGGNISLVAEESTNSSVSINTLAISGPMGAFVGNLYAQRSLYADFANSVVTNSISVDSTVHLFIFNFTNANLYYPTLTTVSGESAEVGISTLLTFDSSNSTLYSGNFVANGLPVLTNNSNVHTAQSGSGIIFSGTFGNLSANLANLNIQSGSFGSGTTVPVINVGTNGLITGISSVLIGTKPTANVTFSSSPNFDLNKGFSQYILLGGNVISSTVNNAVDGQEYTFIVQQPSNGNCNFSWPNNFSMVGNIGTSFNNTSNNSICLQKVIYVNILGVFLGTGPLMYNGL